MSDRIFIDEASDLFRTDIRRRSFFKNMLLGSAGAALGSLTSVQPAQGFLFWGDKDNESTVSMVTGEDRRDMVYQSLKPLEDEIREGVRGKQVIIKVNMVGNETILCAAHPDAVRGVLDFLKPIYDRQVIIAESTGRRYNDTSGTMHHFDIYGYPSLVNEYNAKLVDLNQTGYQVEWLLGPDGHPWDIRICRPYLDPDNYFISVSRLKTHNCLIVTMSAKNMLMGAPFVDAARHDKSRMHTPGIRKFNYNMFLLAKKVHPQLAVLDGLEGMEGNGPTGGTEVKHGVALASTDFVAADAIGCKLMGVDFDDVGYLTYCANAGLGRGDYEKINVVGADPARHVINYRMHDNFWGDSNREAQMSWKY